MKTVIALTAILATFATAGFASTIFSVTGQTDANGNSVTASATLSLSLVGSTEVLTVILENDTANQTSDGENITGLKLNLDSSVTGASYASGTGTLIQIGSGGTVTSSAAGSALSHWTAATSLSQLTLTTIGGGAPVDAVIGTPNGSGIYTNANGSLTGGTKQPYSQKTATFTINLTGTNITLSSFTGASIGFGTAGTNYITTGPPTTSTSATPEPGSFWLLGTGAAMISLASQRKRFINKDTKEK